MTAQKVMVVGFDGADPKFVNTLMEQGKLPNFQRLRDSGVTTKSVGMIGALPTITPPCWATLANGAWPGTHGITCFWNHTLGNDLDELDLGWSSKQTSAEFIWDAYAKAGKKSIVFNYPTSFPPTSLENVTYIDGTNAEVFSKFFIDMDKLYFGTKGDFELKADYHGKNDTGAGCVMTEEVESKKFSVSEAAAKIQEGAEVEEGKFGELFSVGHVNEGTAVGNEAEWNSIIDKFDTPIKPATGWADAPQDALEVVLPLNGGQLRRLGLLIPENGVYQKLAFYASKKAEAPLGEVTVGQWSGWIKDHMLDAKGQKRPVAYKLRLFELAPDGSSLELYITCACLLEADPNYTYPREIGQELLDACGPIVNASNAGRPYAEIGQETWDQNLDWCADAINYLLDNKPWDLFYCHLHAIDVANHNMLSDICPESPRYERFYPLLVKYYESIDRALGKLMKQLDGQTAIFVVSDHAGLPRKFGYPKPLIADS